ncbi:MAG: hypothetical protein ACK5MO_16740, partial [Planctomyces sp.]
SNCKHVPALSQPVCPWEPRFLVLQIAVHSYRQIDRVKTLLTLKNLTFSENRAGGIMPIC